MCLWTLTARAAADMHRAGSVQQWRKVKPALDEFSTEGDAECTGRNSRASSLQKDRGLGAGPHVCEISHQDKSLHTQCHSGFSTSFSPSATALKHQHPHAASCHFTRAVIRTAQVWECRGLKISITTETDLYYFHYQGLT